MRTSREPTPQLRRDAPPMSDSQRGRLRGVLGPYRRCFLCRKRSRRVVELVPRACHSRPLRAALTCRRGVGEAWSMYMKRSTTSLHNKSFADAQEVTDPASCRRRKTLSLAIRRRSSCHFTPELTRCPWTRRKVHSHPRSQKRVSMPPCPSSLVHA